MRGWSGAHCVFAVLLAGCGTFRATIPAHREAAFNFAVQRGNTGDHATAAAAAWRYHADASPEDPRYDRALRLLARSAEALDLSWAASLWYLEIAQARRAPELVAPAIEGLERIIEGGPSDEDTLITGFLATEAIGGLPDDLQAFVDYQRGLHNARQGLESWANARFEQIRPGSAYRGRALYAQAVGRIADGDLADANERLEALLETLLETDDTSPALRQDARRSLARLAMDAGDYATASLHYETLRQTAPNDPQLLLEMAWAHYHQGQSRRALGLLLALDAPIYQHLIAPDRFLLEALALRRLCQFGAARRAAVRLARRHGDALRDLYAGVPLLQSQALRTSARSRPGAAALSAFARRIEVERARVERLSADLGPELSGFLATLYARGAIEAQRRLEARLATEVDRLAEELLAAEEGVRLILHELSVALLRGRRRPTGPPEAPGVEIRAGAGLALFRFEGEFWTDELDDLVVSAEDRCID